MNLQDRYDKEHKYGNITFYLSSYEPYPEQCRYLMLKVIDQAIRDYCLLVDSELPNERVAWETARAFIYDDYYIEWGTWNISAEEFLAILDIDILWFREQVTRKFNNRDGVENGKSSRTGPKRKATKSNSTSTRRNSKGTR